MRSEKSNDPNGNDVLRKAFFTFTVGEERVQDAFLASKAILASKRLILSSPIPFSIRDEIELHKALLTYVDACISMIEVMIAQMGMVRQDFPLSHELLRQFRNRNHHNGYAAFMPVDTPIGRDFYVWPIIFNNGMVSKESSEDQSANPYLLLSDLIDQNQSYVMALIDSQRKAFYVNGHPRFRIRNDYAFPGVGGGQYRPMDFAVPKSSPSSSNATTPDEN
ncbi:MAG: hypothetical protein HZA63_03295 [Rhodocyclales bacterium]|nr:hypothetical protein [Rhodocyclales bacterium]